MCGVGSGQTKLSQRFQGNPRHYPRERNTYKTGMSAKLAFSELGTISRIGECSVVRFSVSNFLLDLACAFNLK